MENVRNRVKIKLYGSGRDDDDQQNASNYSTQNKCKRQLTTKETKFLKRISQAKFQKRTIFNEHLVALHLKQTLIKLDKPIAIGQAILDISKSLMYDFYYQQLKRVYGDRVRLLMTDTDSLFLELTTEDMYEDLQNPSLQLADHLDLSDYPATHPCHDTTNRKVAGKFKVECADRLIVEFVGLRPKMYSFQSIAYVQLADTTSTTTSSSTCSSSNNGSLGKKRKQRKPKESREQRWNMICVMETISEY